MGLIKELLLLPLAPVRGTMWVAEQLAAEAERQLDPRAARRRALLDLEQQRAAGQITDDEFDLLEDEILQQTTTTMSGGVSNGGHDEEDDAPAERLTLAGTQRDVPARLERERPQADDGKP